LFEYSRLLMLPIANVISFFSKWTEYRVGFIAGQKAESDW
jgi:hypothetical protein